MARTLSQDLRDRVVAAIDGGMSCRAAAAHFDVSISRSIRWRRHALQHGRAVAKPRGGDRHSARIKALGSFIKELVAKQGDITLAEIRARLSERVVPVGIGTVHRSFARHGITRKKRPGTRSSKTGPTS
jgi:transposase